MNDTNNFVYVLFNHNEEIEMIFHSKLRAIQFIIDTAKRKGYSHFMENENIQELSGKSAEELNRYFFTFFIMVEYPIIE